MKLKDFITITLIIFGILSCQPDVIDNPETLNVEIVTNGYIHDSIANVIIPDYHLPSGQIWWTSSYLYNSQDNGNSYKLFSYYHMPDQSKVGPVAVDESGATYVGFSDFNICEYNPSTNQYLPLSQLPSGNYGSGAKLLSSNGNLCAVNTSRFGLYRRPSGQSSWYMVPGSNTLKFFDVKKAPNGTIWASTQNGLYYSTTDGYDFLGPVTILADHNIENKLFIAQSGSIFFQTANQVFMSNDNGVNFSDISSQFNSISLNIWFSEDPNNIIYFGSYESSNGGSSWTEWITTKQAYKVFRKNGLYYFSSPEGPLIYDKPLDDLYVFEGFHPFAMFGFTNEWPNLIVNDRIFSFRYDLMTALEYDNLKKGWKFSDDYTPITPLTDVYPNIENVNGLFLSEQKLFVLLNNFCFRSVDGGANWTKIIIDPSLSLPVVLEPWLNYTEPGFGGIDANGNIYQSIREETTLGVVFHNYKSTDEGLTWQPLNVVSPSDASFENRLRISGIKDNIFYGNLITIQGWSTFVDEYQSNDGGLTWTQVTLDQSKNATQFYLNREFYYESNKIYYRSMGEQGWRQYDISSTSLYPDWFRFYVSRNSGKYYLLGYSSIHEGSSPL